MGEVLKCHLFVEPYQCAITEADVFEVIQDIGPHDLLDVDYPWEGVAGKNPTPGTTISYNKEPDETIEQINLAKLVPQGRLEDVYRILEKLLPRDRKLELFGPRWNTRPGWTTVRAQILSSGTLAEGRVDPVGSFPEILVPDEDMNGSWEHNLKMVNEAPETSLIKKNWRKKLPAEGSGIIQNKAGLRYSYPGSRATVVSVGYSRSSNQDMF
eukprot:augustus_masked-scaffold_13-processed-gene-9.12-mRNA-1 protein AED:1.00 eAED:1.00 QI:0/0/0/0/1/1/2/0/211